MGYLQRVVRRASGIVAGQAGKTGPSSLVRKPAIASQSPLADLDQRLHLDAFVEHPELVSSAADNMNMATAPQQGTVEPEIAKQSDSFALNNTPPSTLLSADHPFPPPANKAADGIASQPTLPNARQLPDGNTAPVSQVSEPVESVQYPDRSAEADDIHIDHSVNDVPSPTDAHHDVDFKSSDAKKDDKAGPGSYAELSGLQAELSAVQRWIGAGSRPESTSGQGDLPMPENASRETNPAGRHSASQVVAARDRASGNESPAPRLRGNTATRVEIGSIEVEVIAPAAPAAARQPQRRSTTPAAGTLGSRPFGWRQR